MPEQPIMTEAQRDGAQNVLPKLTCRTSREMLTQEGAQHFIDDLKKQLAERK